MSEMIPVSEMSQEMREDVDSARFGFGAYECRVDGRPVSATVVAMNMEDAVIMFGQRVAVMAQDPLSSVEITHAMAGLALEDANIVARRLPALIGMTPGALEVVTLPGFIVDPKSDPDSAQIDSASCLGAAEG